MSRAEEARHRDRSPDDAQPSSLHTSAGEMPLHEYRVRLGEREWTVLHTGAVLSFWDEQRFLSEQRNRAAYGVALWPAAIALAHEVASRADAFRGRRVLELGAGTGLPGFVAASAGARVVQTDRHEMAMSLCTRNAARNGVTGVEHRIADWTTWGDVDRYDWILGADVIYSEPMHPHLRHIFESNLAAGGRVLLADPFRSASLRLMEAMEGSRWRVAVSKWSVAWGAGEETEPRAIGVYELTQR